jgi:hypothetical protein
MEKTFSVASPISGRPYEVAGSLKGSGHVSCVAILARSRGKANVGCPAEALCLGGIQYIFPSGANKKVTIPYLVVTSVSQGRFVESKGLQVVQSGERTNTEGKPVGNLILLSASDTDYSSLRPHLEFVSLPNHLVLHEGSGKLEFAYFPNGGLISLVVVMKDGKTAEAGIVGNEGFT